MRILLLGCNGFVGRQAAATLAARSDVSALILADYDVRIAKKLAKALSPKCNWAMVDASKRPDLERLLHDIDVVASAVGPAATYEETILSACAHKEVPVAIIGDAKLHENARRELNAALRHAGVPAITGCGLMPGWTDLLLERFLAGGTGPARTGDPVPFLFFSPDRFGGYAFYRRTILHRSGAVEAPPGAPPGLWRATLDGHRVGIPSGKPARRYRLLELTFGRLGGIGNEFFSAFLYWAKDGMRGEKGSPVAIAGVYLPDAEGGRTATVTDPDGRLAAATLSEMTVRLLEAHRRKESGLLSPAALLGKKEAEDIAKSVGATIIVARQAAINDAG
ncbi:MAG TPA: saccharopine dehydrogenase NADP-binding domain-containing protein [Candidatus Deferrimicrobiaceae bacterium]